MGCEGSSADVADKKKSRFGEVDQNKVDQAILDLKVTRDRLCLTLDAQFPGYGLAQHKGYGTRAHLDALRRLGPSPCHRSSFAPVRALQDDLPFPD